MISLIWAQTKDGVIGNNNTIPWHIKEEFEYFKQTTLNHTCVMGRKTWDSLPKKPLPNRKNIILTRDKDFHAEGGIIINDIEKYIESVKNAHDEIFILGGKQIFEKFIHLADRLYVSIIKQSYSGDTTIMDYNKKDYSLVKEQDHEKFTTYIYQRRK